MQPVAALKKLHTSSLTAKPWSSCRTKPAARLRAEIWLSLIEGDW